MVLANEKALALVRDVLDETESPAPEGARDLLESWRQAGLFLSGRPPYRDLLEWRPCKADALFYTLNRRRVSVRCEDTTLAEDLNFALAPIRSASTAHADAEVDVLHQDAGYAVFLDGEPSCGRLDVYEARHLALREVLAALQGAEQIGAVLHAAAVCRDGGVLVLAGESGAGKSTMAMRLIARGWQQVSDDLVGLDGKGAVLPFPTCMALKPGSWPLADPHALAGAPMRGVGEVEARYVDAPARAPAGLALGARVLIFPEYRPDTTPRTARISPEEAFLRLIQCGAQVAGSERSVASLAYFAQNTPAYALVHAGGPEAERACEDLFEVAEEAT